MSLLQRLGRRLRRLQDGLDAGFMAQALAQVGEPGLAREVLSEERERCG
jgi:hypothetical protein